MVNDLFTIFKALLLVAGCLVLINIIITIVTEPFKKKKQKEVVDEFTNKLDEIAKECIEELKKEQENKKKTTTKTRKKKEN